MSKKSSGSNKSRASAEVDKPVEVAEEISGSSSAALFGILPFPQILVTIAFAAIRLFLLYLILGQAYNIRTIAIQVYGNVIHEFDPWFNFRATEYLEREGWTKFFTWFDYMSWYPLGRPVGTTIYPGMQFTAVFIYRVLGYLSSSYEQLKWLAMSLNDVCVYIPAWFGCIATSLLGLLTYECTGSANGAVVASAIMAIIPAHLMRSVGGGYDNESIAMSAMLATFYFWCRSLRSDQSWPFGILTGVFYAYMVAVWGGFIFVLNMIGLHAGFLLALNLVRGVHSTALYRAYSLWFIIGTFGATRVPVVSWMPFKSLEQLAPFALFIVFQLLEYSHRYCRSRDIREGSLQSWKIKIAVLSIGASAVGFFAMLVLPSGYFGPLSARVRGLFVQHTRTGNPLVDSVAEHQPANERAFNQYLHHAFLVAPYGLLLLFLNPKKWQQSSFLVLWAFVSYYFCLKMSRLIILAGPITAALNGEVFGFALDWCWDQFYVPAYSNSGYPPVIEKARKFYHTHKMLYYARLALCAGLIFLAFQYTHYVREFQANSNQLAQSFSEPRIMFRHRFENGKYEIIDDYRQSYQWLRANTPSSSRVLSWWDYGYQITGIGNRTTLADGNTWNHEHIATIGYMMASPLQESYTLVRHVADYVLVWRDDLGKSPHMARIGNSVYSTICPDDPTCMHFGFYDNAHTKPSPSMEKSLLYNLVRNGDGMQVDSKYFKQVYASKYQLVKIFKVVNVSRESKQWIADPANKICDAPGSWYCVGQYPPAQPWVDLLKRRKNFKQLEDFNKGEADKKYHEQYMRKMKERGF